MPSVWSRKAKTGAWFRFATALSIAFAYSAGNAFVRTPGPLRLVSTGDLTVSFGW